MGALLLAACGADVGEEDEAAPTATFTSAATPDATAAATAAATPGDTEADSTVTISAREFCEQADLTITRWELPPALTDSLERGTIELRYRVPPGAEVLVVWMEARIEVGEVTFGDLFRLNPALAIEFPNADPGGIVPATIPSHGFDIVFDGRTHTIVVLITLPPERSFDDTSGWRWSELTLCATPRVCTASPTQATFITRTSIAKTARTTTRRSSHLRSFSTTFASPP